MNPPPSLIDWIDNYTRSYRQAIERIPAGEVAELVESLRRALAADRQIFVCENGGSASNASHFVTDLGKGASDKVGRRFRCLSLNDNVSWMTAIGNDYNYADVFVRQLENYGRAGDMLLVLSVSGQSSNVVRAVEWANRNGLDTIAIVGAKRGRLAELAARVLVIDSEHYGHVEDAHMTICHMLCYAFMELPELAH